MIARPETANRADALGECADDEIGLVLNARRLAAGGKGKFRGRRLAGA